MLKSKARHKTCSCRERERERESSGYQDDSSIVVSELSDAFGCDACSGATEDGDDSSEGSITVSLPSVDDEEVRGAEESFVDSDSLVPFDGTEGFDEDEDDDDDEAAAAEADGFEAPEFVFCFFLAASADDEDDEDDSVGAGLRFSFFFAFLPPS